MSDTVVPRVGPRIGVPNGTALACRALMAAHPEWRAPLTFHLPAGELLVLRTTPGLAALLLRLCLGLAAHAAGTLRVLGADPGDLARPALDALRGRVGSVLAPDGILDDLTVRDNVMLPLLYRRGAADGPRPAAATDETLGALELAPWAAHRVADVAADVRQVAALARALAIGPELLLLDDPLASVGTDRARRLLRHCRSRAGAVLVATHRRNDALYALADRVLLWDAAGMRDGG